MIFVQCLQQIVIDTNDIHKIKRKEPGNVFTPNRDQLPTVGSVPFLYITLQGEVLQDQFIPTLGCYYRVAEPLLVFSRPLPCRRRK